MRAAVLTAEGLVVLDDVPAPEVSDELVLVRVAYNGICGSDLTMIRQRGITSTPHPLTGAKGPQILGHEFSGVVEAVGANVSGFKPGQRVVAQPNYHCDECPACVRGLTNLCQIAAYHGISSFGGGLSEFTALPAANLHHLPDEISLEAGALIEPLAVAYRAVDRGRAGSSSCVAVLGAGPIGLCIAMSARAAGVERIVISEPSASRRAVAESLGFRTVDPTVVDLATHVRTELDAAGADVVFECAGTPAAFSAALSCVGPQGRVLLVGVSESPLELSAPGLLQTEAAVLSSLAYQRSDFEAVIGAMRSGAYPIDGWVERASLGELPTVIHELDSAQRVKVLIDLASSLMIGAA